MDSNHYRMQLNNYLQSRRELELDWRMSHEGPNHAPIWTAKAYIGEREYGAGRGTSQGAAKEAAAKVVLDNLKKNP
ncbi:hypothetical protein POSPLADRAFT_1042444 [Postia placenta MAD-698-R-SB12]|uniref:DRBM domain-containing protein n=2 Tax=Rhodonia placenta TaxID=104341 RepID=A0A1X6NF12_9APHY|nr:hypothetical protein POSPLADRAFT_1042444 [Postia placenta MAD-698-R-SB12]OSX67184.1 hypothetical protein POSPLADRAFT_1042444 [Postia placenta MAD-698-R-SB12]